MSNSPSVEDIYDLLEQAQKETQVVLTIEERSTIIEMDTIEPPENCWAARQSMTRYLDNGVWKTAGPEFERLQEWVRFHWNPHEEKPAPSRTVLTSDRWGWSSEAQLDAVTATRKLIAAASLYGADSVGKHAVGFAEHGTIETCTIYLLKGPPVGEAKPLDEHCTFLPCAEALRKIRAEFDPGDTRFVWPEPHSDNVCALECRHFERVGARDDEYKKYTSPLLTDGLETLMLVLGIVWGCGFRMFANWYFVPAVAAAMLPYRHTTLSRGSGSCLATLAIPGYGPPVRKRPLAVGELRDLVMKYSELPEQARHKLRRSLSRLRDSVERTEEEDRTVDIGIALQALFMDEHETGDQAALIARRAAWHYADSEEERRRTESRLGCFFDRYSDIVQARASDGLGADEREYDAEALSGADEVLRASLKSLIVEGLPDDWDKAQNPSAVRCDPPRPESEISSAKSDSLSWSVAESREIDRALEAEWRPVVDEAPLPPAGTGPATVSGDLPTLAASYREQGIPYVVIHPARLYMAHPKWPKSETDPLDERAEYYCARDVERHTQLWSEAAASRGLVQFKTPTGAESYHPKYRDHWAQPLLSSHEAGSGAEIPGQEAAIRQTTSPPDSTQSAEIERREHTPAAPPSEWPQSAIIGLEREWSRLWSEFQHDVNVATGSLIHLLEAIHNKHLAEKRRLIQAIEASNGRLETIDDALRTVGDNCFAPIYPKMRALPVLSGEPLFRRTAPDGPMEQSVFRGWVCEVWDLWESRFRTQLKHEIRGIPGAIRPRQQVLGDLRHIRNNLLHNGIAKSGEAADCEILQWFEKGEGMQVRLRHVLDFLNQMGWLTEKSFVFLGERGAANSWHVNRTEEIEDPPPLLVSVRPLVNPEQEDPRFRYEASMVFENGVFGRTPMGPEREETEAQEKERTRKWMKMTVNREGDLHVPGLGTVSAARLYRSHLKGEKRPAPGLWRPWVQFRE